MLHPPTPKPLTHIPNPTTDLAPTPADRRTLGAADFAALWVSLVVSTTTLMLAGSLVDMGMSWIQVIRAGGAAAVGAAAVGCWLLLAATSSAIVFALAVGDSSLICSAALHPNAIRANMTHNHPRRPAPWV